MTTNKKYRRSKPNTPARAPRSASPHTAQPLVEHKTDTIGLKITDSILAARYYRNGETSYDDVCKRVARAISTEGDTEEYRAYYNMMVKLEFLPNSPTLMNAGTTIGQLSACFTLPVEDSLPQIFDAVRWGAIIHQSGGGTGYNFSNIRPEGSAVKSTDGVASGPVSFMRVFDAATDVIKQGGRRRGANMGILNIWHKDILKFIKCKAAEGDFSNFNISVMVSDDFMRLVKKQKFDQIWLTDSHGKDITVGEIWDAIAVGIHQNGEPGVLFYDTINKTNPLPELGAITTTNPCGEQPLLPFESCVLGSINLSKFAHESFAEHMVEKYGGEYDKESGIDQPTIDMDGLIKTVKLSVRFLDSVIDKNVYPIPQIKDATLRSRKIGLGLMGVHDALLTLGIPYDSDEAREEMDYILTAVNKAAIEESVKIAREKGAFPAYKESRWVTSKADRFTAASSAPMRNAALTTIAPTGSISLLAGCSSGIEPVFSYVYDRKNTVGKTFRMIHPIFARALWDYIQTNYGAVENDDHLKLRYDGVIDHVYRTGTLQDVDWLDDKFRALFKTALDIKWDDHLKMQAVFQKHIHASISKTINLPNDADISTVKSAILFAWRSGCKGVTLYRNGSRKDVVLALKQSARNDTKSQISALNVSDDNNIPSVRFDIDSALRCNASGVCGALNMRESVPKTFTRPKMMRGRTFLAQSGCCRLYVTVNSTSDGAPMEVFIRTVGAGCEANSNALGRSISTGLQNGIPYQKYIRQLGKVKCEAAIRNKKAEGMSCADIVGRCIRAAVEDDDLSKHPGIIRETTEQEAIAQTQAQTQNAHQERREHLCPDCGKPLDFAEGCNQGVCKYCGWSGCG